MKTIVTDFLRDQSGTADFDGTTIFLLLVAGPIAVWFLLSTFGGVYDAVFGLVGSTVHR
jgi:Flp pilus assembly pilin Flp